MIVPAPSPKRVLRVALLALALWNVEASALQVRDYDPAVNDRFASGYPSVPVANAAASFVARGYDLTGVGWIAAEPEHAIALITPRHFVRALHEGPDPGEMVQFVNAAGQIKSFTVVALHRLVLDPTKKPYPLESDMAICTLDRAVTAADGLKIYPILDLGTNGSAYVGQPLLVYGQMARIAPNVVRSATIDATRSEFSFEQSNPASGMGTVETGDSGSPSFIPYDGRLTFAGAHWQLGIDTMAAGLLDEIRAVVAADGQSITVLGSGAAAPGGASSGQSSGASNPGAVPAWSERGAYGWSRYDGDGWYWNETYGPFYMPDDGATVFLADMDGWVTHHGDVLWSDVYGWVWPQGDEIFYSTNIGFFKTNDWGGYVYHLPRGFLAPVGDGWFWSDRFSRLIRAGNPKLFIYGGVP